LVLLYEGSLAQDALPDAWRLHIWGLLESEYPDSPSSKTEINVFDADGQQVL
jgi:hypothetical protein